jgi:hypothetical protein
MHTYTQAHTSSRKQPQGRGVGRKTRCPRQAIQRPQSRSSSWPPSNHGTTVGSVLMGQPLAIVITRAPTIFKLLSCGERGAGRSEGCGASPKPVNATAISQFPQQRTQFACAASLWECRCCLHRWGVVRPPWGHLVLAACCCRRTTSALAISRIQFMHSTDSRFSWTHRSIHRHRQKGCRCWRAPKGPEGGESKNIAGRASQPARP